MMSTPATDDTNGMPGLMAGDIGGPASAHLAETCCPDKDALIREAQRGNSAAFGELVRHYDKAVLRLAIQLTGSEHDAQDLCQEAFLSAYRNLMSFRFECSFYTWIYRIVTNRCLDYLRKRQVRKEDSPVVTDADGETFNLLDQVADDRPPCTVT